MQDEFFYGLKAGMTYEEVKSAVISISPQPDIRGEWYNIIPQDDDLPYENFACKVTKDFGLTRICAWTKNIKTASNGAELYSLMTELRQKESSSYGSHRFYNVKKDGTQADPEKTFTIDLINKNRYMIAVFNRSFNSTLPQTCQTITLQAFARDEYSGNIHKKIHLINDDF